MFQDITKLTPLSPEVISRQATINMGTIGHVSNININQIINSIFFKFHHP